MSETVYKEPDNVNYEFQPNFRGWPSEGWVVLAVVGLHPTWGRIGISVRSGGIVPRPGIEPPERSFLRAAFTPTY